MHCHCCPLLSHDASSARLTRDVCFTISRAALARGTWQGMLRVLSSCDPATQSSILALMPHGLRARQAGLPGS